MSSPFTASDLFALHAARFTAKDVEALAAEYDDKSIMKVSLNQGAFHSFTGWKEIRPIFEGLFNAKSGEYGDGAELGVQGVDHTATATVLLWTTTKGPKDVKAANDTFIINPETNKWAVQTVFVHHA